MLTKLKPKKVLFVFGTRPEAIKMCPLIIEMKRGTSFDVKVCVTGQHREMLDQVLNLFGVVADYDLNVMTAGQTLYSVTAKILIGLEGIISREQPDLLMVHGDTTTALSGSLAAYYSKIKIGHVEAGLRTGDVYSPWPEEANRKMTAVLSNFHFSPSEIARQNLLMEGVSDEKVFVTGNTVIDALVMISARIESDNSLRARLDKQLSGIELDKKFVLITGHRRENFGEKFKEICNSIRDLAIKYKHVQFVYPVHLNPNVQMPVREILGGINNVILIEPLDYLPFVYLMSKCFFIMTDSGGIQEEAPALGKPVLLLRDTTERPEAVHSGTVKLVGSSASKIYQAASELFDDAESYQGMACAHNPYGEGDSCQRIVAILKKMWM